MLAVRVHAPGEGPRLEEVPLPDPAGSAVRVRVAGCGVCHTDLHIVDGTQQRVELPVTLGHEVAGWVDALGPEASGPTPGAAVLVSGGWGCGACRECLAGAEQRCPSSRAPGFQADGGYAEALLVPHPRHLVPLGTLDPVRAAPLADAGVTPFRAVRRALPWLRPGARVVLIGCGALGAFALQYLRILPADGASLRIVVHELDAGRIERAMDLGADEGVLVGADDDSAPADVVFDFVGSDDTLATAAGLVALDGLVMLVGEAGGSLPFGFERPPVESWLTTVAWGSLDDLREVVALAQAGRLEWNVETMPLAEAEAAHERIRGGGVDGRIVLVPPAR